MKIKFFLILLLASAGTEFVNGNDETKIPVESFSFQCDRSIYASGELIRFVAKKSGNPGEEWSRVFYLDLITPDGQIISSAKYPVVEGKVTGALKIPADAISGSYFLNAYTKWQRNFSPENSKYLSVKILNPFTMKHLPERTGEPITSLKPALSGNETGKIQMEIQKKLFDKREQVELNIKSQSYSPKEVFISVVRAGAADGQIINNLSPDNTQKLFPLLIPEVRGISLTGIVRNQDDNSAASFSPVFLTLLDSERSFYPVMSDSTGHFYFSLPEYTGKRELFISARSPQGEPIEVLIDSDVATERMELPSTRLDLDSAEYVLALEIVQNKQIEEQYYDLPLQEQGDAAYTRLFFGEPSRIIEIGEYIDLPSMEEYFLELLPMVSVLREKGKPRFRFNTPQAEMRIYDPLVLIDGVAVHDEQAVLDVNPLKISSIEIVDSPYLRGDLIFGGIISFTSKSGDFGGVDLPESGLFLNYNFFENEYPFPQENAPQERNIPDVRNTLYWNPELELQPGEEKRISFRTSDLAGEYEVLIREFDKDGRVNSSSLFFRVK